MSMSSQNSSSSSDPSFIETPENSIIDQISHVAQGLAGQMMNWAQGVFAQTSAITNQAVGNFFQVSQNMLGMSNNLTSQYNNLFAPENAQLVADANSYASPARMAVNMGQAGATQAQAGDAGLKNSEEALRSFGIDPSSGRYAALDKAAAVQNAANVAGAENTQRNSDIATGQRLRSEAVQVGAQLPAAISNINNTAIQANAGASNASLANANTGRNLMSLPNDFLKTAMDVKLPPSGQTSRSSSSGMSSSPQPNNGNHSSGGGGNGGGGNGGGGNSPSGPAWMPQHGGSGGGSMTFGGRANPGSKTTQLPGGGGGDWGFDNPLSGVDPNSFDGQDPNNIYQPGPDGQSMSIGDPGTNDNIWNNSNGTGFGDQNPFSDPGFGQTLPSEFGGGQDQTFGNMGGGTDTQWGNIGYDPGANNYDPGWGNTYDQPNPSTDWGLGAGDTSGGGGGGGGGSYDTSSPSSDFSAGDYTAPSDNYDPGGAYARGGAVPSPHAGPVPRAMSPSGGQQVDDVRAQGPQGSPINLNANEFVIPQDVALWKGQEFFQNLIAQSRKKRVMAPAHPTPMAR